MIFLFNAIPNADIQEYSEIYKKESWQQPMDKYVENIFRKFISNDIDIINLFKYFVPIISADIDYSIEVEEMKKVLIPAMKKCKIQNVNQQKTDFSITDYVSIWGNRMHKYHICTFNENTLFAYDKNNKLFAANINSITRIDHIDGYIDPGVYQCIHYDKLDIHIDNKKVVFDFKGENPDSYFSKNMTCYCTSFTSLIRFFKEELRYLFTELIKFSNIIVDSWKRYNDNWSKKNSIGLSKAVSVMSHKILDLEEKTNNTINLIEEMRNDNHQDILNKLDQLKENIETDKQNYMFEFKNQMNMILNRLEKLEQKNKEDFGDYDYESMKETKKEMHREFKNVYKIFRRMLDIANAPLAVIVK